MTAQRATTTPNTRRAPRTRPWRAHPFITGIAGLTIAGLITIGWSYGHALTYPGSASWTVRTVEWVRDHGGAPVVNAAENWYYTRHRPPTTGHPTGLLPPPARHSIVATSNRNQPSLHPAIAPTLAGEAQWQPGPRGRTGQAAIYTSWFRPVANHPTVTVGVAWIDQTQTRLRLVAGTREPGTSFLASFDPYPGTAPPGLLAVFNSGWKLADQPGGFFLAGRTAKPLVNGQASVVINADGSANIGEWGQELHLGAGIAAVRQNLQLIVRKGRPVAGLHQNGSNRWGSSKNQLQFCWRSGIAIDTAGNLVYVAGDNLTLEDLANALSQAGGRTGMELDIHDQMVTFNIFDPTRHRPPVKLLPTMQRPVTRYLRADQRDSFAVTIR